MLTSIFGLVLCSVYENIFVLNSILMAFAIKLILIMVGWLISMLLTGEIKTVLRLMGAVKKNG